MTGSDWIIFALAYILGLLSTNLLDYGILAGSRWQLYTLLGIIICLTVAVAIAKKNRVNRRQIERGIVAIIVAILAVLYFQLRIPQPQYDDISYQLTEDDRPLVQVTGRVLTEPRLNASQRLKFWFDAREIDGEEVSGKLYATLPLLQGTGIYPGQQLKLKGLLYLPQPASGANEFDFKEYLARQGSFAGIQGKVASLEGELPRWGWWRLRQKIVRSHLQGLGSPLGQLVSSMVLGRKAVDLPSHLRDRFIEAGLAHVLAASGFHVSLLLGIMLRLTTRVAAKPRLIIGIVTLAVYLGLTGIQASVLRACLMGMAVLLATTRETKVKPLGSLLLAAVIILLFDPLLIDDLGFRLSFLATFGLIVTLPPLQQRLDWLPKTIAVLLAIPLAASVWVLPLLCYEFSTFATYSLLVNVICTPLITIVSLGGMISGTVALILPGLGSAIAAGLFYPASWLVEIVTFFTNLPASTWAVGKIPLPILLAIYGLFLLIWWDQWWQKRWWLGFMLPLALLTTLAINNTLQVQIAVLPSPQSPIVVIRDRGEMTLINSGRESQAKYTVLPFLAREGINQIDRGIVVDKNSSSSAAWEIINSRAKVKFTYGEAGNILFQFKIESFGLNKTIETKSTLLNIDEELAVANLQIADDTWLIIGKEIISSDAIAHYVERYDLKSQQPILVWSGNIAPTWLELLQPRLAIAFGNQITPETRKLLQQKQIEFHNTATAGMIRWSPSRGFIREQSGDRDNNF